MLTKRQVEEFGWRYDSTVLREVRKLGIPVVLHMCGLEPMIDFVISECRGRASRGSSSGIGDPKSPLGRAKEGFGDKVCLVAGFVRTVSFGSPSDVEKEVEEAISVAGDGGGLILSSGCEIPQSAPEENIRALARAVERYGWYPLGKGVA